MKRRENSEYSYCTSCRFPVLLCVFPEFISLQESLLVLWQSFSSSFLPFRMPSWCLLFMIAHHIFEISDDHPLTFDIAPLSTLLILSFPPGVNSRAELVPSPSAYETRPSGTQLSCSDEVQDKSTGCT